MSARTFRAAGMAMAVGLSACAAEIHPTVSPAITVSRMGELWERPAAIATADLLNGPWGVEHAPDAGDSYTFLRKKRRGTNPGVTVRDSHGREWHVKQGVEVQPEVILQHVLSAVGYHQPPVYFLTRSRIDTRSHRIGSSFAIWDRRSAR